MNIVQQVHRWRGHVVMIECGRLMWTKCLLYVSDENVDIWCGLNICFRWEWKIDVDWMLYVSDEDVEYWCGLNRCFRWECGRLMWTECCMFLMRMWTFDVDWIYVSDENVEYWCGLDAVLFQMRMWKFDVDW